MPPASLRTRQTAATRTALLDAAFALLTTDAAPLTHERVAAQAAAGVRTVYRHFPTQADLFQALWEERLRSLVPPGFPHTEAEIAPRAAEAFGIFMVRQFMVSIPDELIEAARLDGAGEFKIFWRVILPLSWPVVAVLTIFTFMWRWNDFAWPLVVLQDQAAYTVPLGLNLMKGQFFTDWTGIMSMSLVSILPMLVVFIFFQRYFIQGIASTGIK